MRATGGPLVCDFSHLKLIIECEHNAGVWWQLLHFVIYFVILIAFYSQSVHYRFADDVVGWGSGGLCRQQWGGCDRYAPVMPISLECWCSMAAKGLNRADTHVHWHVLYSSCRRPADCALDS